MPLCLLSSFRTLLPQLYNTFPFSIITRLLYEDRLGSLKMNDLHIKESVTSFLFDVFPYAHI